MKMTFFALAGVSFFVGVFAASRALRNFRERKSVGTRTPDFILGAGIAFGVFFVLALLFP